MSLSGALSNALSGLTANSRAASLVASNIANATTESYGRRTLETSSRTVGVGGVQIDGVNRRIDTAVLSDRRLSDAQTGFAENMQTFASKIEALLGPSGEAGSLSSFYSAFENAILSASSDPSSTQRLQTVALAAQEGISAPSADRRRNAAVARREAILITTGIYAVPPGLQAVQAK